MMLFDSGLFFWATLYILRRNHALYIVHVQCMPEFRTYRSCCNVKYAL